MFDSALREVAQRVLPLAYIEVLDRDTAAPPDEVPAQRIASVSAHEEYITYIVRDAKGRVLLQSHDADPTAFPNDLTPGFHDSPHLRPLHRKRHQGTLSSLRTKQIGRDRSKAVVEAVGMVAWPLAALLPLQPPRHFGPSCACLCDPCWPCKANLNGAAEATFRPPLELGAPAKSIRWPML